MARTTVNIEKPVLAEVKKVQKTERKSLGQVVSELLAEALALRKKRPRKRRRFKWNVRPMSPRVDLSDKEQLWSVLDRSKDAE